VTAPPIPIVSGVFNPLRFLVPSLREKRLGDTIQIVAVSHLGFGLGHSSPCHSCRGMPASAGELHPYKCSAVMMPVGYDFFTVWG
jgi:hypothetical protein